MVRGTRQILLVGVLRTKSRAIEDPFGLWIGDRSIARTHLTAQHIRCVEPSGERHSSRRSGGQLSCGLRHLEPEAAPQGGSHLRGFRVSGTTVRLLGSRVRNRPRTHAHAPVRHYRHERRPRAVYPAHGIESASHSGDRSPHRRSQQERRGDDPQKDPVAGLARSRPGISRSRGNNPFRRHWRCSSSSSLSIQPATCS